MLEDEVLSVGRQWMPGGETLYVLSEERQNYYDDLGAAIEASLTWGDFFELAPKSEVVKLRRWWAETWEDSEEEDEGENEDDSAMEVAGPSAHDPFDLNDVPGFEEGDYPPMECFETERYLPEALGLRYGQRVTTVINGTYTRIDPSKRAALVADLRDLGFSVEEHRSLEEGPVGIMDEVSALTAYAKAMNGLTIRPLEQALADDFHYASQLVLSEITSKKEFLDYLSGKHEAIARSGQSVFAELGSIVAFGRQRPCVVLAQGDRQNVLAFVLAEVRDGKLCRLDLCVVPSPETAIRSGVYPT